ncbi:MAG: hypothetical protein ACI86H_002070, partial [bacterium]
MFAKWSDLMTNKIIYYQPNLTGLKIASKKDILWPCHAFKISIPSRKKKALNILEETILKLCETSTCDTSKLADITCLDKEIVKFIQYRLSQLNLLTKRFEITDEAKDLIVEWDSEPEEYIAATIYVDLIGGKLLPVVINETTNFFNIKSENNRMIVFSIGSTGRSRTISAFQLLPDKGHMRIRPSVDKIVNAIKSFKKRYNRFSILTKKSVALPTFSLQSEAITVQEEPELVLLYCNVIVQKGNTDFLVTDPFGYGISNILKEGLFLKEKKDPKVENMLSYLKEKGLKQKMGEKVNGSGNDSNYLIGFSSELSQYPEIQNFLNQAEKTKKEIEIYPESSNTEKAQNRKISKFLKNLYDALEWTLRQVVFDRPVEAWAQVFSSQSYKNNNKLLFEFTKKIGFTVDDPKKTYVKTLLQKFLQVTPGKIKAYLNGVSVEMQPLIALAIAGASQDSTHPFHSLALNIPNSLIFIATLKKHRDSTAHGDKLDYKKILKVTSSRCTMCNEIFYTNQKIESSNCEHKELVEHTRVIDEYKNQVQQIIKTLYPALKGKPKELQKEIDVKKIDINQLRLKAEVSLDKYFGLFVIQNMPVKLSETLINIEYLLDHKDIIYTTEYINHLASVLQILFCISISEYKNYPIDENNLKQIALKKAIEADFELNNKKLPEK